jgi:dTDP-4-amino-4,6-dideoxygalactose transaminase
MHFLDAMTSRNIDVRVYYLNIPEHPYYQHTFGRMPEDFPNVKRIGRQMASLPIFANLADKDVEDVIGVAVRILS